MLVSTLRKTNDFSNSHEITIPKELIELFKLEPGVKMKWRADNDAIILEKMTKDDLADLEKYKEFRKAKLHEEYKRKYKERNKSRLL